MHLSELKEYKCDICDKVFTKANALSLHKKSHVSALREIESYSCVICNKSYNSVPGLHSHMITHDASKRLACDICQTDFSYKGSLNRHSMKFIIINQRNRNSIQRI